MQQKSTLSSPISTLSTRLDLWRVGITPDPEKMATEKGKEIAENTDYTLLINL